MDHEFQTIYPQSSCLERQGEIRKSIDNTSQWKTIEHLLDCLNIHIGRMEQFDAYLFSNMVETVKVKSQTEYEFQLFGGLKLQI